MDIQNLIRKYVLLNALKFNGQAKLGPSIAALFAENPELKSQAKEIRNITIAVIEDINRLSPDEQKREIEKKYPELLETKEEEKEKIKLPPLPNAEKYKQIVTRFAPAPSGALHISHLLRALYLSYSYAKIYNGKFILRYEDTDPNRIDPKFYDWIAKDLKAVEMMWDEIIYESDHFDLYLEKAGELFQKGRIYVDTCTQDEFREYKAEMKNCPHRFLSEEEQVERWGEMLDGTFAEGEAVVRLKTRMDDKNPVLRDPPLLRIIDTPHPRTGTKYRVYPLYNYANTIEDHFSKITHVLRAKEHEHNATIQEMLYNDFGWNPPEAIQFGMVYLPDPLGKIHKRQIRQWLKEGKISGWDDIRLPTIRAFLRRGFHPDAFKELAIATGLSKTDIRLSLETLYAFNRKIIDPIANRYFFVDPVEVIVENVPKTIDVALVPLHPEFPERGNRELKVTKFDKKMKIYLDKNDVQQLAEQELLRLKDFFNITIEKIDDGLITSFHSKEVGIILKEKRKIIHWLPVSENLTKTRIIMPDGSIRAGFSEPTTRMLESGDIIQFERIGFGRVDRIGTDLVVWFAHK